VKAVEGWKKEFLGRVAQLTMGQSPDSKYYSEEENGLPFLQGCAEFEARFPMHKMYCSQTKKLAHAGAILFSVRAPVGKINIADRDYIIGRGLAAISGIDVNQSYLEHYLIFKEPSFRNASQGSTFEAINSAELNGWPINYPTSKPEQTKIAEILSTVDQAIEQDEALIAKQQRIKTGLMQDLLTRGIDEHGNLRSERTHQFKNSPLGRIPVEWEVKSLEQLTTRIVDGVHHTPAYAESGIPFIVITDLTGSADINFSNTRFVSERDHRKFSKRANPKSGDVLVTKDGTLGIARIVPPDAPEFSIFVSVAMLRPNQDVCLPELIWAFFESGEFLIQLGALSAGTGLAHIHLEHFRSFLLRHPPIAEQQLIFRTISKQQDLINSAMSGLHKLKKQKTALMQGLLTGKKRVTALLKKEALML